MLRLRFVIRLSATLAALALLTSACGSDDSNAASGTTGGQPSRGEDSSPIASPSPTSTSPAPDEGTVGPTLEVWFTDRRGRWVKTTYRQVSATPRVGTAAVEALLAGPQSGDGKVSTAIPSGTRLLGLTVDEGIATVDLSSEYESGGGSSSVLMRLAQVVFTLTQFPTVDGVSFAIEGRPIDVFSSEGVILDEPQTRSDFEQLAPPIVVESPRPGATVSSPVVVSGNANVFEATVSLRIVDASGRELVRDFTTATCGTGCRGDYSKRLRFSVTEETEAFIEVFEESAEDGSRLFVVRVPVTLSP